ncbi:ankyrin repeat-containing protein ITN1-like isoform X2 [Fagus crenata]
MKCSRILFGFSNILEDEPNHASSNWHACGYQNGFISFHYVQTSNTWQEENNDCDAYKELYKHVQKGDWEATNEFLKGRPNVVKNHRYGKDDVTSHGLLDMSIVKELVEKMSDDDLDRTNKFGYTALAETTFVGNLQMANCMLEKKKNLVRTTGRSTKSLFLLTKFFFFSSMHFAICRFPTKVVSARAV